eukprot:144464_1
MAAPAKHESTEVSVTTPRHSASESLSSLFKLERSQRQPAVDRIMKSLQRILRNPNNKKLHIINGDIGDCEPGLELLSILGFKPCDKSSPHLLSIAIDGERDPQLSYLQYIYDKMFYKNSARGLSNRQSFDCKELMSSFPPKFKDGRKKAVFKTIVPNGAKDCFGTLIYARHSLIDLPSTIPDPTDFIRHRLVINANIFEYVRGNKDESQQHFYVNFADANLFGFYKGSLFAQDEIMTLEHPILASLREQLLASKQAYCRGAIIILNALKHGHFAQNALNKIYGSKFARSTTEKVTKSVTICKPAMVDNVICIASVMGCQRKYKRAQIDKLLKTAYTGFNGAVCESAYQELKGKTKRKRRKSCNDTNEEKTDTQQKEIIVHTGNWGCGAFGGNIEVHCMIQVIACVAAGVDRMVYHAVDQNSKTKAVHGCKVLLKELCPKCKDKKGRLKTKLFISELLKRGYKWGTPNGT